MKPTPGQYWRSLCEPEYKGDIPKGALVLITEINDEGIHFACGDRGFSIEGEPNGFENDYEFVPNGREQQAKRLAEIMQDLQTMEPKIPKILPLAADGFAVGEKALTVTGSFEPAQVRRAVATARNTALRFKRDMMKKQEELKALLSEQEYALQAKVDKLSVMVETAQEAIWTIELYLGHHEEIKQLKGGKAAPKDTKITIRQLVLNMDEECAVAALEGGIDTENIDEFDKWVTKPKHLRQVFPEPKGIVAFHVRGTSKRGGDPDASTATYFLFRNGQRLYRIHTNLTAKSVLFPRHNEFDNFFFDRDWGANEKTPLRPGSPEYMKAMKKADKKRRHYLRILLFIQGIIDRTKVFKPLPAPRINLCNPKDHNTFLHFVRDAEMLLPDGRKRFDEWLEDINAKMDVGMRVIGEFHSYNLGARDLEYRSDPRGLRPNTHALYTIQRKEGRYFVVLFPYDLWGGHESKKRASFQICPSDGFVVNFDLVEPGDIDFYLSNRLDRSRYLEMFPLLKCVERLRKQEQEDEKPFHKLLAGEIMKAHHVEHDQAASRTNELVRWWKFKNKIHRALTSDDAKAIRMIVKEFGLAARRKQDLSEQEHLIKPTVTLLRKVEPDAIYIGHRKGKDYVTISPMNVDDLFIRERVWQLLKRKKSPKMILSKEWVLLDKRVERWEKLWATERWSAIKIGIRRQNVLTDPEITKAIKWGFGIAKSNAWKSAQRGWSNDGDELKGRKYYRFLPLAATWHPDKYKLLVYYSTHRTVCPDARTLLTSKKRIAAISYMQIVWKRKKDDLRFFIAGNSEMGASINKPPWMPTKEQYHHEADEKTRIIQLHTANIELLKSEKVQYKILCEQRSELKPIVERARAVVEDRMYNDSIAAEHQKYRDDLKDESLWEEHLKEEQSNRNIQSPSLYDLIEPIEAVVETRTGLAGRSLGWVLDKAKALGYPMETDEQLPLDLEFAEGIDINPPEDETEEYDEEEDS